MWEWGASYTKAPPIRDYFRMLIQFAFLMRADNVLFVDVFKGHSCCEQLFGVIWCR